MKIYPPVPMPSTYFWKTRTMSFTRPFSYLALTDLLLKNVCSWLALVAGRFLNFWQMVDGRMMNGCGRKWNINLGACFCQSEFFSVENSCCINWIFFMQLTRVKVSTKISNSCLIPSNMANEKESIKLKR